GRWQGSAWDGRPGAVRALATALDDAARDGLDLVIGETAVAFAGHQVHRGEDLAGQVRPHGGGVLFRGVVERLERDGDRVGFGEILAVQLLEAAEREQRAG